MVLRFPDETKTIENLNKCGGKTNSLVLKFLELKTDMEHALSRFHKIIIFPDLTPIGASNIHLINYKNL